MNPSNPSRGRFVAAVLMCAVAASCASILDADPTPCVDFYQFGSSGCAELVVIIEEPVGGLPQQPHVLGVSIKTEGGEPIAHASRPEFGPNRVRVNLHALSSIVGGETTRVWAVAALVRIPQNPGDGNLILAADSVFHPVAFASVGDTPDLDTVTLRPR